MWQPIDNFLCSLRDMKMSRNCDFCQHPIGEDNIGMISELLNFDVCAECVQHLRARFEFVGTMIGICWACKEMKRVEAKEGGYKVCKDCYIPVLISTMKHSTTLWRKHIREGVFVQLFNPQEARSVPENLQPLVEPEFWPTFLKERVEYVPEQMNPVHHWVGIRLSPHDVCLYNCVDQRVALIHRNRIPKIVPLTIDQVLGEEKEFHAITL